MSEIGKIPAPDDVSAAYDRWAPTYDKTNNPMVWAATHALADGLASVKGLDCLELGCGTGRNLAAMAKADPRTLTGIDLSSEMLRQAKMRALETPDPAWKLIQHDLTMPIPLPSASFNFVLSALTFEHIANLATPLREARRLLRHYGILRIVEIHPFMTFSGEGAHFKDGEEEVAIASYPHQFEDWFKAFDQADLAIEAVREWHTNDFGVDAPHKITRRRANWPWLVDFTVQAR
jgi:ubiquinone/menaquinone biosynthesis C-methylase UbiE